MNKVVSWCVVVGLLSMACGPVSRGEGPAGDEPSRGSAEKTANRGEGDLTRVATRYSSQDLFRGLFFGRGPAAALLPQVWGKGMPGAPKPEAPVDNRELAKRLEVETAALAKAGLDAQPQQKLKELTSTIAKNAVSADELKKEMAIDTASANKLPVSDEDVQRILDAVAKTDPTFFGRFGKMIRSGDPAAVSAIIEESGVKLVNSTKYFQSIKSSKPAAGGYAARLGLGSAGWPGSGEDEDAAVDDYLWITTKVSLVSYVDGGVEVVAFIVLFLLVGVVFGYGAEQDFGSNSDPLRHDAWMKIIASDLAG